MLRDSRKRYHIPTCEQTIPTTVGFEIEQPEELISQELRESFVWHHDSSGPLETSLGPTIYPRDLVLDFIREVKALNACWKWVNELPSGAGCGSHIHLRPRPSRDHRSEPWNPIKPYEPLYPHPESVTYADVWSCTYNTIVEIYPFIIPLFAWGKEGDVFRFRQEVLSWASINKTRYGPMTLKKMFLSEKYVGHPCDAVSMNRTCRGEGPPKVLTIELRLSETHIVGAYFITLLINRIIQRCYVRNYIAPKIMEPGYRDEVYRSVRYAIEYSCDEDRDLYECLEEEFSTFCPQIVFYIRIPGLKSVYTSYFEIFSDILKKYLSSSPEERRFTSIYLRKRCPADYADKFFDLLEMPKEPIED